jgi:predicted transcriptional regulator
MAKQRSRFEIYLAILAQVESGAVVLERIMSETHLSRKRGKVFLDSMVRHGLLEERTLKKGGSDVDCMVYTITEKGARVLGYCRKANDFLLKINSEES